MAFNTKTFFIRLASAVVFTAILLTCVNYSYYTFSIFFTAVGFLGLHEFYKLSENLNAKPNRILGYLLHAVTLGFAFFLVQNVVVVPEKIIILLLFILFPLLFFLFVVELFRKEPSIQNVTYTVLAWLYVSVPCVLLLLLSCEHTKSGNDGGFLFLPQKVIGCILFTWINDTGAYLVGSFFGKHKLYEKISPGKTWEGTIGGILLSIGLAYFISLLFPQLAYKYWIAIGVIVSVFGTLGDLVESLLKRTAGIKDTGSIMPGHGGVLDRFDSLFFSIPFVFCYLAAMGLL